MQSDSGKPSDCEVRLFTRLWNQVKRLATKHVPVLRKRSQRAAATEFLVRLQTCIETFEASSAQQQSELGQRKTLT